MKPPTRLFVAGDLAAGTVGSLTAAQAHRLRNVLRLGAGAPLALFNGRDGEWLGRIEGLGKGGGRVAVERQLRPPAEERDLALVFAPIKRGRLDDLVEKATELGVAELMPVWTERTIALRLNRDRLAAIAIEAAEQCERLTVPRLAEPRRLSELLAAWPAGRRLVVCDESGAAPPIAAALAARPLGEAPAAVLIGPEGGLTETELDALSKLSFVTRAGLGPRVLRSETAALAALAVVQALAGDWSLARQRSAPS